MRGRREPLLGPHGSGSTVLPSDQPRPETTEGRGASGWPLPSQGPRLLCTKELPSLFPAPRQRGLGLQLSLTSPDALRDPTSSRGPGAREGGGGPRALLVPPCPAQPQAWQGSCFGGSPTDHTGQDCVTPSVLCRPPGCCSSRLASSRAAQSASSCPARTLSLCLLASAGALNLTPPSLRRSIYEVSS